MDDISGNDLRCRVKPKHGEMSCGDCRVSKHNFRTLEKLMHRSSDRMGSTDRESERGWPISHGRSERYWSTG